MKDGPLASLMPSSVIRNRLRLGVVLVNLFVFVLAGLSLQQSREQYREQAAAMSQNLCFILQQYISGDIDKIDLALLGAVDDIEEQIAAGSVDSQSLNAFLGKQQQRLPHVETMRVVDVNGIVVTDQAAAGSPRVDLSDRDFFIRLRQDSSAALVIAKPVISRINQKWILTFARRLNKPDGGFAGVVYSTLTMENLSRLFSQLDIGKHGLISLRDAEMGLITRFPELKALGIDVGSRVITRELQRLREQGLTAGTYYTPTGLDSQPKTISFRKVEDYPLFILVGLASEDYLAEWQDRAIKTVLLLGLFLLMTLVLSWLFALSWKRQEASVAALAGQETKFRTMADFTYDWEYWEGPEKQILYMTPSCERITGYSQSEFMADPELLERIVLAEDLNLLQAHRQQIDQQRPGDMDFRIRRRDGEIRWIAHACQKVLGPDGQFMGRRVSNRDITERKQVEAELREKSAALQHSNTDLEQFAYSVSHDMRQPLRAVSGHLQLLERELKDSLDPNNQENLAFALDGAKRMDAMIVSLLDYSRVGRKTEAKHWLESRQALDEALGFLAPVIEESQAALEVDGEWPRVFASRDELTRLFQNLIDNALKYREPDQPPRVAVASEERHGNWRVSVTDHGIGIDPQQIGRLFQFFSRLQSRARYEGTGMGLALCRRIVEHHGGRIWAESAGAGQGCVFIFEMPLQPNDATEFAKPAGDLGSIRENRHEG